MICDCSWQFPYDPINPQLNWKGYVYHGSDLSLYDSMVTAPAESLFISEMPPNGNTHRVCPSKILPAGSAAAIASAKHYAYSWPNHFEIDRNKSDLRHGGGVNYIFFDGHVKWMTSAQSLAPKNMWTLHDLD